MTMNDYVCVGKIVNTHGIKGELRILSFTLDPKNENLLLLDIAIIKCLTW